MQDLDVSHKSSKELLPIVPIFFNASAHKYDKNTWSYAKGGLDIFTVKACFQCTVQYRNVFAFEVGGDKFNFVIFIAEQTYRPSDKNSTGEVADCFNAQLLATVSQVGWKFGNTVSLH